MSGGLCWSRWGRLRRMRAIRFSKARPHNYLIDSKKRNMGGTPMLLFCLKFDAFLGFSCFQGYGNALFGLEVFGLHEEGWGLDELFAGGNILQGEVAVFVGFGLSVEIAGVVAVGGVSADLFVRGGIAVGVGNVAFDDDAFGELDGDVLDL